MKKFLFLFVALALQLVLAQSFAPVEAQAAPGDFLFMWGAQQHYQNPAGVTIDKNGNVYVTDIDNVQVFNSSGVRIRKWGAYGSGDGQLAYPTGIAVDKTGKVYVVDSGNNRVQVFDGEGKYLGKWRHDWWGGTVYGIAVASNGNVYVADPGSKTVKIFDGEGNYLRSLPRPNHNFVFVPDSVAFDASGLVYVRANEWVDVYSPDGTWLRNIAFDADATRGLAVDRDGNIYRPHSAPDDYSVQVSDIAGNRLYKINYVDPYRISGSMHGMISIAVAVDEASNVFVVDGDNDGVRGFDRGGKPLSQWWTYGTGDAQLSLPKGMALDSSGNVYETDDFDLSQMVKYDRIRLFDSDGKFIRIWRTGESFGDGIRGVALDAYGNMYGLGNYGVRIFDSSGNLSSSWSAPMDHNTAGIAVDSGGKILVSGAEQSKISIFDKAGALLRYLGTAGTGNGQFAAPHGMAVDNSGNIYVADTGNSRIQIFDSAYNFLRTLGGPGFSDGLFTKPEGVAVDGNGNVYVADTGNSRVQAFDSSGTFLGKWGSQGDNNGQFREPRNLAVSRSGARVYVADTMNNRIQVFEGFATFSIAGNVREGSAAGPPLADAVVTIGGASATTDGTGAFSIAGMPAGSYTLSVDKAGYTTFTTSGFAVKANQTGLVFFLDPEQDTMPPTVTGFTTAVSSTSLTVQITSFEAVDNRAITGYLVTETSGKPAGSDPAWSSSKPAYYTVSSEGKKTLYAWARDAAGNVSDSVAAQVTVKESLPSPWSTADIGHTGLKGSAGYANGMFTVKGAGADIWGTADAFRFVYQPMSGDGEIVTRVTSVQNTDILAKGGVMFREAHNAKSTYVMMNLTAGKGAELSWRGDTGGSAAATNKPQIAAPYWVKLARNGNRFTGFVSPDAASWTEVGSVTIPMARSVFVGLVVNSHDNAALCTAVFDKTTTPQGPTPPGKGHRD